ncbi:MotA/TolQ/ExbB proton channel family protein [Pseudodesulfovibrio sp. zrk46]|uniref:MotA/TolQ/ExbB proton channel family protein n=1 Tax=Pseudodesulfovibrio sp. zrk46 TaxID=2725288 RepID=UPI001449A5F1|nr:MotA/TolQ/ExbB proton channel family protein [Pseudodesulfovibrio sp. zrk46]QJB56892.1 MotA/TolQ/ExbB proton channel family protein [Pseudodesulfovibrio sp. zrk46]
MVNMIKSILALIASIVVVHMSYLAYIRPQASKLIDAARAAGQAPPRDFTIILRDYEQEICIILLLWGAFLIVSKCLAVLREERHLFSLDLYKEAEEHAIEIARENGGGDVTQKDILLGLDSLPSSLRDTALLKVLRAGLRRYLITGNVQNAADAIESGIDAVGSRMDAENSMIRYIIWAIPSIGFIGTVRGIGEALSQANQALSGDIGGMTGSLGVAFNSTLVALLISIVLMFLLNYLQRLQDDLLVETQSYCEEKLLNRISRVDEAA